jgi:anaerobic ribonucleoside-triphosphate reductase
MEKAAEAANISDLSFIEPLTENIINSLLDNLDHQERIIDIEEIQDMVEDKLMEFGHYEIAKKYIIYREKRAKEREEKIAKIQEKFEERKLKVTKSN